MTTAPKTRWAVKTLAASLTCAVAMACGAAFAETYPGEEYVKTHAATSAKAGLTQSQRAEIQQRFDLAKSIVNRLAPEAAAMGLAAGWRQSTMDIMLAKPSRDLAKIASAGGYRATMAAATSLAVRDKALGSTTEDLVYKPITPCRYIDTRNVGGKISGLRGFDLSLASYGGDAGCVPTTVFGVGDNAIGAIVMNIAIFDTSTSGVPGTLQVRPTGATSTTSLMNWFVAGPSVQDSNQAIVTIDQGGSVNEFDIVSSGPVHVIVDFFGAFLASHATALDCLDPSTFQTIINSVPTNTNTGFVYSLACTTGYTSVGGACYSGIDTVYLTAAGNSSDDVRYFCNFRNLSGAPQSVIIWNRCCRVPGR